MESTETTGCMEAVSTEIEVTTGDSSTPSPASSSSVTMALAGDPSTPPPPPSAPRVTEEESQMASEASRAFNERHFTDSLRVLSTLSNLRPEDPRVLANLAVCQFVSTDSNNLDDLAISLKAIYGRIVEANGGDFDENEHAVLVYNIALVAFHRRQFALAEQLLHKLYTSVTSCVPPPSSVASSSMAAATPSQEDVAFATSQVLPLLIAVSLCLRMPSQALALLPEAENKARQEQDEEWMHRCLLCRAQALVQSKQYKMFKRDLKPTGLHGIQLTTYEFLRSNLEYVKGNHRKATKLLALAMNQQQQQHADSSSSSQDPENVIAALYTSSMYQNNMGCLHVMLRKPNLGVFFYNEALARHSQWVGGQTTTTTTKPKVDFTLRVKKAEIIYNMGMALLHAGQPEAAFDTLLQATAVFSCSANLWLHMAECCVAFHRDDGHVVRKMYTNATWAAKHISVKRTNNVKTKICVNSKQVMPDITMEFAAVCLEKAEELLKEQQQQNNTKKSETTLGNGKGGSNPSSAHTSPIKTASPASTRSHLVMAAIVANRAYVCLCLNDHAGALEQTNKLMDMDMALLPPGYRVLARLYAAEALVGQGHYQDALINLDPSRGGYLEMSFNEPANNDNNGIGVDDVQCSQTAKAVFLYNVAVTQVMRGELDRADDLLDRMAADDKDRDRHGLTVKVFSLRLYVALSKGNVERCRELAKKHTGSLKSM